jgi:uncharacterized protein YndB with AHSA1/START domain
MPEYAERSACPAAPEEVWKLLHDPARFPDWWAGTDRVEAGADGGVTRYAEAWPDYPYPLDVASRREGGAIVISCLQSDVVYRWTLSPAPGGCEVEVLVTIPEAEAARLGALRDEASASLARLVEVARTA